ncbi:unannotated protein [freshwater metagenome]|uniref:Unannotated protein n=1 Tax=freshwater metagenome TaxID=449393 RepID=A0A6J6YGT5_9ZZZZ
MVRSDAVICGAALPSGGTKNSPSEETNANSLPSGDQVGKVGRSIASGVVGVCTCNCGSS